MAGGEGDDRGWDGWMALLTRWTWVWVSSGSWWWTGKPGMLRSMGSQRSFRHNWATEVNWTDVKHVVAQPGTRFSSDLLWVSLPMWVTEQDTSDIMPFSCLSLKKLYLHSSYCSFLLSGAGKLMWLWPSPWPWSDYEWREKFGSPNDHMELNSCPPHSRLLWKREIKRTFILKVFAFGGYLLLPVSHIFLFIIYLFLGHTTWHLGS